MSKKAGRLRGRSGAVLLAAGALLGAVIAGPGGSIAASVMNLTQTSADKRYVKSGSVLVAGRQTEAKQTQFTSTTFTPVVQTTIKAPTAGFLQITGTISAEDDAAVGAGHLQYRLKVGSTPLSTDPQAFELDVPDGGKRQNGSITGYVKVAAPGTQTISLEAQEKSGATGATLWGRSISAVFVPKGKFPLTKTTKKKATKPTGNVGP
jgi:hypothetical protein